MGEGFLFKGWETVGNKLLAVKEWKRASLQPGVTEKGTALALRLVRGELADALMLNGRHAVPRK